MRTAYIASPIDRARGQYGEAVAWVAECLSRAGWVAYVPSAAWVVASLDLGVSSAIWNVNEQARSQSDVLIAVIHQDMVSAGVPTEIALSLQQNKPVVLIDLASETTNYGAVMGHFVHILPRLAYLPWHAPCRPANESELVSFVDKAVEQWNL